MSLRLVAILLIVQFQLYGQEKIIVHLPHSIRNVEGTKFLKETLGTYTGYWVSAQSFPDITRRVSLPAGRYTLKEILRKAYPGVRLLYVKKLIDNIWCLSIAPEAIPKARTTVAADAHTEIPSMTPDTTYPDGYQRVPILSSASSFSKVDTPRLGDVVSTDLVDHFVRISSGVLQGASNSMNLSIHGRSSIWSYNTPLFVLNNFPYYGNFSDINPHDVVSVTILKDAASSAIWGSFSSNNVIVVGTGEGRLNQRPRITATVNMTSTERPRLNYLPGIGNDSFIAAEKQFFNNGYYNPYFNDPNYALSPVVEILRKQQLGTISGQDASAQLSALAGHHLRSDLNNYFYRCSVTKDYHINVSGGGGNYTYYLGMGLSQDNTTLQHNGNDRRTLNGSFNFYPSSKIEAGISVNIAGINQGLNNPGGVPITTPYAALADNQGNPLAINYKYNRDYIDSNTILLDRHFLPLRELNLADNRYNHFNVFGQLNLSWHIRPWLTTAVLYRQDRGRSTASSRYDSSSWYVHDPVDQSLVYHGNDLVYGLPPGYMRVTNDTLFTANNLRMQATYTGKRHKGRQLVAMAGAELSDWTSSGQLTQAFGLGSPAPNTRTTPYNSYSTEPSAATSINSPVPGITNRYVSLFANASYTWHRKLSVYGLIRNDASNNQGVDAGHRWSPFWAISLGRQFIRDPDTITGRPGRIVRLRGSYGVSGNISKQAAVLATQVLANNIYGLPQSGVASAPDPDRRWERNAILNLGIDLQLGRCRKYPDGQFSMSLDVYSKYANRLIGVDHLPLSSGVANLWSNSAAIRGYGADLSVDFIHKWKDLEYRSGLVLSVARDWVSQSLAGPQLPLTYIQGYPMAGKPVTAIYSYKYAGLDGSGDPQGLTNDQGQLQKSKNYLVMQSDPNTVVVCSGALQPQLFGYWQQAVGYRGFSFSFGLTLKAAFVVRRPTVNYGDMAGGFSAGEADYYRRWKKPGDELLTNIPALPQVNTLGRDVFFSNSDATIIPGDFLRLQDCRFSYLLKPQLAKQLGLAQARFYIYAGNLGIIWRANSHHIDPDAVFSGGLPAPRSLSVGTQISF